MEKVLRLSTEALEPLVYEIVLPVEYKVADHDKKFTIFVPPNLDSSDWVMDGERHREVFTQFGGSRRES